MAGAFIYNAILENVPFMIVRLFLPSLFGAGVGFAVGMGFKHGKGRNTLVAVVIGLLAAVAADLLTFSSSSTQAWKKSPMNIHLGWIETGRGSESTLSGLLVYVIWIGEFAMLCALCIVAYVQY